MLDRTANVSQQVAVFRTKELTEDLVLIFMVMSIKICSQSLPYMKRLKHYHPKMEMQVSTSKFHASHLPPYSHLASYPYPILTGTHCAQDLVI